MIDVAYVSDPDLHPLLARHPRVARVEFREVAGIEFEQGPWHRSVTAGDAKPDLFGLVELLDNNPLVCADSVAVPDPASTLALIALGPLSLAGLVTEAPTMIVNVSADEALSEHFLASANWTDGIVLHAEPQEGIAVAAATVIASIQTPPQWSDIDDLYEERFGRSFFVRREEEARWDSSLVEGSPYAVYNLRYTPGEETSLLTVQVMADLKGKCGPGQLVHAMNVMAGFEESLGLG